jgi:two-component sensor histidine kinase
LDILAHALMSGIFRSGSKPSIRFYLVAIVVVVIVPFALLVALLLLQLEARERAALEQRVAGDAYAIAVGVGRQLQDMATTLRVLASAPELEHGDLAAFHRRTQGALRGTQFYVIAVDGDGQQLLNTRVPFGTQLGSTSNMAHLDRVLETQRADASGIFHGQVSGEWVFDVTLPVAPAASAGISALIMTQNAAALSERVTKEGLLDGWSVALIDPEANVIATSDPSIIAPGATFSHGGEVDLGGTRGVSQGRFGSSEMLFAYSRVPNWNWKAVIWGPPGSELARLGDTWRWLILGGLALLAIALSAAFALARRLRRSVVAIADMAERLGTGEIVAPIDTVVAEADMVAHALADASFSRSEAEERMHLVQRELVHRTKNLFSVVQSILNQMVRQGRSSTDFHAAVSQRLESLGRSVDLLTAEQWEGVPIRRIVAAHLETFVDSPARVEIRGSDFLLKPDAVQNLGLALHELATNAIKHGALSVPGGRVVVDWQDHRAPDGTAMLALSWSEAGGPQVRQPRKKGFGTTVLERVTAFAFRGNVHSEYAPDGFRWTLTAPADAFRQLPASTATA